MAEIYGEQPTEYNARIAMCGTAPIGPDAPRPIEDATTRPKARIVTIQEADHGYIVTVGCQSFALESRHRLLSILSEYLAYPDATEKKYREGKLFE